MTFLSFLIWGCPTPLVSQGYWPLLAEQIILHVSPSLGFVLLPSPLPTSCCDDGVQIFIISHYSYIQRGVLVLWWALTLFNATVLKDFTFRKVFIMHLCYGKRIKFFLRVFMLAYRLLGWDFGGVGRGGKRLLGDIADQRLVSVIIFH